MNIYFSMKNTLGLIQKTLWSYLGIFPLVLTIGKFLFFTSVILKKKNIHKLLLQYHFESTSFDSLLFVFKWRTCIGCPWTFEICFFSSEIVCTFSLRTHCHHTDTLHKSLNEFPIFPYHQEYNDHTQYFLYGFPLHAHPWCMMFRTQRHILHIYNHNLFFFSLAFTDLMGAITIFP